MTVSKETASLLLRLADPDAPPIDLDAIDDLTIEQLANLAERHGVLSIIGRKLAGRRPVAAEPGMRLGIGQAMLLEAMAKTVITSLRAAGVDCAIVKGPVFSRRLYDHRADRLFTDIDLLFHRAHLEKACDVMIREGFQAERKAVWDNSHRDMEFKWTRADNHSILFELHGNLVHYPLLRRRVSFGYEELVLAGQGDTEAPEALLCAAIVHAACGHKFHRLQMVVDILQAARRLPDDRVDGFVRAARGLGFALEAAVSLSLAGRLFSDHRVAMLGDRFGATASSRLGRRLISPDTAIQAADPRHRGSRARRKAFRLVQYLS